MKEYITADLNRAAYLVYCGAKLTNVIGGIGDAKFYLDIPKSAFNDEKQQRKIEYIKYMSIRQQIKEQQRVNQGLPKRYMESKPFTLEDLAR